MSNHCWSVSDYVEACGGITKVKGKISLEQILQMRSGSDKYIYFDFIEYFVSAVIGKKRYKANKCDKLLSTYASISDEALALLAFENNFDTWYDMAKKKITKGSDVPRKYTNGGSSKCKVASSKRDKGWSTEGLLRFNALFDLVEKDRMLPHAKQFEEEFRKYCEDIEAGSNTKKKTELIQEVVMVRHEMWSDDEDEVVTAQNCSNEPVQKRRKVGLDGASVSVSFRADCDTNAQTSENEAESNDDDAGDSDDDDEGSEAPLPDADEPVYTEV